MTELRGTITTGLRLTGTGGAAAGLKGEIGGGTGALPYQIGAGLKVEENVLMVDTAGKVEQDNTRPVTSAAVYVEIGNIEALLASF